MKTKTVNPKISATVKEVIFICNNLLPTLEEIHIPADKLYWNASAEECECCGSHGEVSVEFKCPCGHTHSVMLRDW